MKSETIWILSCAKCPHSCVPYGANYLFCKKYKQIISYPDKIADFCKLEDAEITESELKEMELENYRE